MYPIDILPAALAEQSLSRRHIIIEAGLAPEAISWLAGHGWAITSLRTRYFEADGDMTGFEGVDCAPWRQGERWEDHVRSVAEDCLRELSEREMRFARAPEGAGPPLYAKINAWPANPHLEQTNALLLRYFSQQQWMDISPEMTELPLLAANVRKNTPSFTEGQKLYVYNVRWPDQAMVVGRYRRKHRWIYGYCAAHHLDNFRPQIVRDPHLLDVLKRQPAHTRYVTAFVFRRFLPFPLEPEQP